MAESLKEKTAKGLFWGALNSGTTQLLNLVIGIFLGRLISPAEYGIVGVLNIFTLIAGNLQSSGFSQGLINLKSPQARDYNSVFWFNILAGFVLYVVLFASAPLIASYFRQPCLVPLSRLVFLSFVISSFGIAHGAYMTKNMMNREIAIIGAIALVCSGSIAIVLAFLGFSYWSLAWQQIVYIAVLNLGRYWFTPWHPSFHFTFEPVKRMFGFSVKVLITNIINTVSNNILTLVFGRLYPIKAVGDFTQAYKWDSMANSFVANAIGQVAQPVLASVHEERGRAVRVFRKMMRFTAFISFPLLFGLALVAKEFIVLALTEKWLVSVPLLQILCISGAVMPLCTLLSNMILSKGRSNIFFGCTFCLGVVQIVLMLAIWPLGIRTMVMTYTALNLLWLFVWHVFTRRLTGYTLLSFLSDILPFALSALGVMVLTGLLTRSISSLILLLTARILLSALLYYVVMRLARVKILDECTSFVLQKIRKR